MLILFMVVSWYTSLWKKKIKIKIVHYCLQGALSHTYSREMKNDRICTQLLNWIFLQKFLYNWDKCPWWANGHLLLLLIFPIPIKQYPIQCVGLDSSIHMYDWELIWQQPWLIHSVFIIHPLSFMVISSVSAQLWLLKDWSLYTDDSSSMFLES